MIIQIDTREQKYKHVEKWFEENDIQTVHSKMYVGDYTRLDNQTVCIDRKQNLQEVCENLTQGHKRFVAECGRAQAANIKLIVLVQDENVQELADVEKWTNPRAQRYYFLKAKKKKLIESGRTEQAARIKISKQPPTSGKTLCRIMETVAAEYGVEWKFCKKADTGRTIWQLLGGDNNGGTDANV